MAIRLFQLSISGMSCSHCERTVTSIIENIKGVTRVTVSLEKHMADIMADDAVISLEEVIEEINKSGVYTAHL